MLGHCPIAFMFIRNTRRQILSLARGVESGAASCLTFLLQVQDQVPEQEALARGAWALSCQGKYLGKVKVKGCSSFYYLGIAWRVVG